MGPCLQRGSAAGWPKLFLQFCDTTQHEMWVAHKSSSCLLSNGTHRSSESIISSSTGASSTLTARLLFESDKLLLDSLFRFFFLEKRR